MSREPFNVLFLCTGNSARSIMAESIINFWGKGRFKGYSAGSASKGSVHPSALELLTTLNLPTDGLRSKNWEEFSRPNAQKMDFVLTVCDRAGAEPCPVWPGRPMTAHWGVADPAAVEGDDIQVMQAFRQAFHELEHRIKQFVSLPVASLDSMTFQQKLQEIGRTVSDPGSATSPTS